VSQHQERSSRFYGFDLSGDTRVLADAAGLIVDNYSYKAFGEELQQASAVTENRLRFGGQYGYIKDASDRLGVRARIYRPSGGKWLSNDPLGFDARDYNLYRYVQNNPVNRIDASGLMGSHPCLARATAYCDSAEAENWCNRAKNGFCYVATELCIYIMDNSFYDLWPFGGSDTRRHLDCLSRCMFSHWQNHDTPQWKAAEKECSKCGKESQCSRGCCQKSIRAEQNGLTRCDKICRSRYGYGNLQIPNDFPFNGSEAARVQAGITQVCYGEVGSADSARTARSELRSELFFKGPYKGPYVVIA